MFELENERVYIEKGTWKAKKAGKDITRSLDLRLKTTQSFTFLECFAKGLSAVLFQQQENQPVAQPPEQGEIEGVEAATANARYHELTSLPWKYVGTNYRLIIDYGAGEKSNLIFINVKLSDFELTREAKGGSVIIKFTANINPNQDEVGKLYTMHLTEHDMTFERPPLDRQLEGLPGEDLE